MTLTEIADALRNAPRTGSDVDEPEGARIVVLSDTLAREIEAALRREAAIWESRR